MNTDPDKVMESFGMDFFSMLKVNTGKDSFNCVVLSESTQRLRCGCSGGQNGVASPGPCTHDD